MLWHIVSILALAAWFGGGIIAGFVAPQAAFRILTDRQVAGTIAGAVLGQYGIIKLCAGLVYSASWLAGFSASRAFSRIALVLVVVALLLAGYGHFALDPKIAAMRDRIHASGETPELTGSFGALHAQSVVLFGIEWLLVGVALAVHVGKALTRHH
jgi:hypothetical protein